MVFTHPAAGQAINQKMIDMLISQMELTPLERVRESAMHHLYAAGVSLKQIADAYERDLAAGDRILNQKSDADQNAAPETQQWLQWLAAYEEIHRQLQRISAAVAQVPEKEGM